MRKTGINMEGVKRENRSLILHYINNYGPVSRKDIATATHLTPASVSQITTALLEEGILKEAAVDVFHHVVGYGETPSVDGAAARDADIFLLEGEDHAGPAHVRVLDIVPGIERTQQSGARFEVQRDIVFDIDGARHPVAGGEHDPAATVCARKINGCLNALGIECDPVCPGAEIRHEIVFRSQSVRRHG